MDLQTRIGLVQCYYECGRNYTAGLRRFRTRMDLRAGPCKMNAYRNLIQKFERTGSVTDLPRSGRPRISDVQVAEVLHENQNIARGNPLAVSSANAISKRLQVPYTTVWKILRKILKMYPYKLKMLFELKEADLAIRYDFSLRVLAQIEIEPEWLSRILWTDEAHFTLNGGVNTQNCRIWSAENPQEIVQEGLHDKKVTVWCGFTADFIIGPYFYEEMHNGEAVSVTVNGERYLQMLRDYVIPQLQNEHHGIENIIFMQDGAPPHIFRPVKELLTNVFQDRVLSRHFANSWPPRSPDLNPADYWLWGYLKSLVFIRRPTTLQELKDNITEQIGVIQPEMLRNAVYNIEERLVILQQQNGGHIEQLP